MKNKLKINNIIDYTGYCLSFETNIFVTNFFFRISHLKKQIFKS